MKEDRKEPGRLPEAPWSAYPTDVTDLQQPEPHAKPHELAHEPPRHTVGVPQSVEDRPHYHAVLFPVSEREVGYRETDAMPKTLGAARLAAVFLGLLYVLLSLAEDLLLLGSGFVTAGGNVVLEYAQPHNSIHWLVALVLVAACFTRDPATRILVLSVGVVFLVLSAAGFMARLALGNALGHDGALPWTYLVGNTATAVIALLAGLASRTAVSPPHPGVGRAA